MVRHCNARLAQVALGCVLAVLAGCSPSSSSEPSGHVGAAATASGGVNRPEHLAKPYIVLVSIDGFRTDYLDRFQLPNFRRVLARGARAPMVPVFPTITFPNQYSLVTGLHPGRHGIVENAFWDPERRARYSFRDQVTVTDGTWYGGEPIWVTAERQGMVAACFYWPGSEAAIKEVRPTFWKTYDGRVPNATRVDTVVGWLRLPEPQRPHVLTLYFNDVDAASHNNPLGDPGIEAAARAVDSALGALIDGIEALPFREHVYLLLTSDHGMTETRAEQGLRLSSVIDDRSLRVGFSGPVTSLHIDGGTDRATAVRDRINARLQHGRAYLRSELPERYHARENSRFGDVVIVMDEGWLVETSVLSRALIQRRWGEHGWDPALPSMQALFVISGPTIHAGTVVSPIENVDVYPLMTELLGLRPAENIDGRAGRLRQLVSSPPVR